MSPDLQYEGELTFEGCFALRNQLLECCANLQQFVEAFERSLLDGSRKREGIDPDFTSCLMNWNNQLNYTGMRLDEAAQNIRNQQGTDEYNRKILSITMCVIRDYKVAREVEFDREKAKSPSEIAFDPFSKQVFVKSGFYEGGKRACPNCGAAHDAYTAAHDEAHSEVKPSPGDLMVCGDCGSVNRFDDNLDFVAAEEGWEKDFDEETLKIFTAMREAVRQRIRQKGQQLVDIDKKYHYYRGPSNESS